MNKTVLFSCLLTVVALTGCSGSRTKSDIQPGYGYSYDYDYEANTPEYSRHFHTGVVAEVFYLPEHCFDNIVTGSILSETLVTEIIDVAQDGYGTIKRTDRPQEGTVKIIAIRLPGGDTLYSVQKNSSFFSIGQSVEILGTGTTHRVVSAI